jgi:GT2 family glycosyltransferase
VTPAVTAVVLAYGDEPWVERCVEAILASADVRVDVVVVDNGCTTGAPERLRGRRDVTVLVPAVNLGFAGGCNTGAAVAGGEFLALVNADALVHPDALRRLCAVAAIPGVGIASGSIRLAEDPSRMNSAGNPVHFTGLSWAGGFGEPAVDHAVPADVASASGAGLVLRKDLWDELGGFAPDYFAYVEDTELSLRCWQRGLRVVFVPDAVVVHRYEFSRNELKNFLLERNRLLLVLTTYERRTLWRLLPALLLVEVLMGCLAMAQGWAGPKARGWWWLVRRRAWVAERRRLIQSERTVGDDGIALLLTGRLSMGNVSAPPGMGVVNAVLSGYWRLARPVDRG